MIVVRLELHSAIDGQVSELARMNICNIGGTKHHGDYQAETFRGRSTEQLDRFVIQRQATVTGHPRLSKHVWHLVAKALIAMGYGK